MTNYNDGKWHGWNGGECPVHPETLVEYVTTMPCKFKINAGDVNWETSNYASSIVSFRVVKEYKEPRETWLVRGVLSGHWYEASEDDPEAVLFREVIE